jgi:class 3 adenylate cyclase/predicted ATPase
MKCARCQRENPAGMKFCGECAAPLASTCPSCGAANPPENKFCGECAAPLRTASTAKFAAPGAYTPKHLAEKILTSRSALEGERKQVTVLFADLKGSMELLADRDPEEARKILDPVLEHMMEAVHRYEGTVNQVMGDGIMALFGAPLAHEDHAVRACFAALRMQESVRRYAEEARRAHGTTVRIRVGLNSGEVVVRAIGSDLHMDYTAVGQTTHLAARMEQLADPGHTLLSLATLQLAEGYIEVKTLGPVPVKGLAEPVEIFELAGAGAVRSRLHAAAARGLTRFVGRDSEVDQLRQALNQAGAGHGQVVAVVGEPGVGKSRLYWEFTHSHRIQSWLILESGSVSYGKSTAYLPVIDLLKGYFQIEGRDDARKIREKVTGKVLSLDRVLEPVLPSLLSLLDVPVEDEQWERLDPPQRRHRTLDGIKRLLLRESQVQPLMLLFEDLHWIDTETQALLDGLVESVPTARLVLLVNYRPEYQHGWGSKTYYRQLHIAPLPAESAEALLDGLLGADATVQPLKALLTVRTGGNPLFLEESVRTLLETKALVGERGAYRLAQSIEAIQVPATVQAILAARIDRLPGEEKALLQVAAVIGKDVPLALLEPIAELREDDLRRSLARLQAAEFLYETRLFPDPEYTFKHALTHEVAYAGLLHDRRRALHAGIVDAIERLYTDRLNEQLEPLAHHAVRGEVWGKAVGYLREAGSKAFMRSANAEALAHFSKGLDLVKMLPETPEQAHQELRLHLALGPALQATRGLGAPEVELAYTRARQLCEQVGDPHEMFQALWGLWLLWTMQGKAERGRQLGEELLVLAQRSDDQALLLEAHHALWATLCWVGESTASREHIQAGMALYDREQHRSHAFFYGGHDPGVCCRLFSGITLWALGYPARALEDSNAGLTLAEELSHPFSSALALVWDGMLHQVRGEVELTRDRAKAAITLSTEHGFPQWLAAGLVFDGWARAEQGEAEAGIAQLCRGLAQMRATGAEVFTPYFLSLLAAQYLKHGNTNEGLSAIEEGLSASKTRGQHQWTAELYRLKGELLLARSADSAEEAEASFRRGIDTAAGQQAKSWELRAWTSLGRLLRRQGRGAEIRPMLLNAHGWFTEGFDTGDLKAAQSVLDELSTG